MKRRIVELSPISLEQYQNLTQDQADHDQATTPRPKLESATVTSTTVQDNEAANDADQTAPAQCLFCLVGCDSLADNLDHMGTSHGFHIPHLDRLETDVDTLLAYLHLVINHFHACLYCGHEKQSGEAVRAHMLSKGHCMLDLSADSDFQDFWQPIENDRPAQQLLSATEMRTAGGVIVTSRQHQQSAFLERAPSRTSRDVAVVSSAAQGTTDEDYSEQSRSMSTNKSLALRDQMGIMGLSDAQKRGLAVVQKKMIAREQRSRNEARWVLEKFGNKTKQKHFKPDVPGRKNG